MIEINEQVTIKDWLLTLPEEIETFRMQLLDIEEALNSAQEIIKNFELEQSDEIANATFESDGKSIYSNDSKRRAELERRRKESLHYTTYQNAYNETSLQLKKSKIKLETLYNTQENLRAICRLGGN